MKIKIHGSRGSFPTTKKKTFRYGGNTSCVEVRQKDEMLIVDAGTGLLRLSDKKIRSRSLFNILLTHLHIDHIQGLGFFKPFFNKNNEIHIWGPACDSRTLKNRLNRYLSPPLFPIHFRDIPSKTVLHEVSYTSFKIGSFKIISDYISHPGPTVGYRISCGKSVLAYLPDHEPMIGNNGWEIEREWVSGMRLAYGADILIHDSQYTREEYDSKIGWGHSTMENAIHFAEKARVKKLLLFHHDPGHSDKDLDKGILEIIKNRSLDFTVELAKQGGSYSL